MARITAYTTTKQDEIIDETVVDFNIQTSGSAKNLRKTQEDGTVINLGNVKGPTGPAGPIGGGMTEQDVNNLFASLQPPAWEPFPTAHVDWDLPTDTYQPARWRVHNGILELDGHLLFTGLDTGSAGLIDAFNQPPPDSWLLSGPNSINMTTFRALRVGPKLSTVSFYSGTGTLTNMTAAAPYEDPWTAGEWLAFCGVQIPLEIPN